MYNSTGNDRPFRSVFEFYSLQISVKLLNSLIKHANGKYDGYIILF